jgi:hypothetical protein
METTEGHPRSASGAPRGYRDGDNGIVDDGHTLAGAGGEVKTPKLTITCTDLKPLRKNTLRGFAALRIDQMRMTIRDCACHQKGGSRWVQPPGKPQIDKDGQAIRQGGKISYAAILEFDSPEVRRAFSEAAVRAVLARCPDAFDEDDENSARRA